VVNANGQRVDYAQRTSNWGATFLVDDQGRANGASRESFSVDIQKMDCAGGTYQFWISHYSGPSVTSTLSATQGGRSAGTWSYRSVGGQQIAAVSYTAQPQNCRAAVLSSPRLVQLSDGNDLIGVVVFPADLNLGYNFVTRIDVPTNYIVKRMEVLKTASELAIERNRLIVNSTKTQVFWLFADTAIGFIPVVGDLAAFARGGIDIYVSSNRDIAAVTDQYLASTSRTLNLVNARNVKVLIWYQKISAGDAAPTMTTTALY
jgi:hypothetical protein